MSIKLGMLFILGDYMKFRFKFNGRIYYNDTIVYKNKEILTFAYSAKEAINNCTYHLKNELDLSIKTTKLYLSGTLIMKLLTTELIFKVQNNNIIYDEECLLYLNEYTKESSSGKLSLNNNATKPFYADLHAELGKTTFSKEHFLFILFNLKEFKEEKPKFKVENKGVQISMFDYNNLEPISNDTFLDEDENEWIFDPEEGVYWKNGIKYGEYLTSL